MLNFSFPLCTHTGKSKKPKRANQTDQDELGISKIGEFKENNSLNNETSSASDSLLSNGNQIFNFNAGNKISSKLWKPLLDEGADSSIRINDLNENSSNEDDLRNWSNQIDRSQLILDANDSDRSAIYECDKCDKKFGKQSSLARHKYEHSGKLEIG